MGPVKPPIETWFLGQDDRGTDRPDDRDMSTDKKLDHNRTSG